MEIPGDLRIICRLCWSHDLCLHWEDGIAEINSLSYKDCFYKYTQLAESADHLSQRICKECAENIKNFHLMVEKSVETLRFCEQFEVGNGPSENDESDKYSMDSFPFEQCNTDEQGYEITEIEIVEDDRDHFGDILTTREVSLSESSEHLADSTESNDLFSQEESHKSNESYVIDCDEFVESSTLSENDNESSVHGLLSTVDQNVASSQETKASGPPIRGVENKNLLQDCDEKSSNKVAKTRGMCSYCSKIVHDIYYLKLHEQTHEENRQREVACPTCGIKLYDKRSLYQHMKIHETNRVKKHKCEFCDKAFFSRGSCNIHRRIHLDQMFQCSLCPKRFYRQIDLNKHMPSHSQATLSSNTETKPKKYYVHCKECDRKIASNRFNGHRASHMNDPFMRCTVCEKDFCSRKSGGKHMARVHKRKGGDYDDITFYYQSKERPRLSLLLMKQQEDVEPVE